jgi:hypothetical protein
LPLGAHSNQPVQPAMKICKDQTYALCAAARGSLQRI